MKLEALEIELQRSYDPNPGHYIGKIKFSGQSGTITVPLSESTSLEILKVISKQIVSTSKELAHNLSVECIEHVQSTDKQLGVDKSEVKA